jgi:prepilin-type N-terminal cleavage/methylation domain-containing protein
VTTPKATHLGGQATPKTKAFRWAGKGSGFSLLEMVIVLGILSVLVGGGVVTLVPFKERREVLADARGMASLLKQVQAKASAVEVPLSCSASGVGEFELDFSASEVNLLIKDPVGNVCETSGAVLSFSNGTEIYSTDGAVVFKTPSGSTDLGSVGICNYGIQYDLELNENGSVSEPKKSETPGC